MTVQLTVVTSCSAESCVMYICGFVAGQNATVYATLYCHVQYLLPSVALLTKLFASIMAILYYMYIYIMCYQIVILSYYIVLCLMPTVCTLERQTLLLCVHCEHGGTLFHLTMYMNSC